MNEASYTNNSQDHSFWRKGMWLVKKECTKCEFFYRGVAWFVACMLWTNMNDYIPPVQSSPPPSKGIPKTMWWWNRCQITLLSKSDTTENMLLSPAKFWPIHLLFKSIRNVSNTNQKLGLRNNKEGVDKVVGWPDPNPGATQLDLPTGICPHAPLHSSYPPSPSRYARMLRQPHECHFKLHTGASLMDSRTTQAGEGIYDKQQQRSFCRNTNFSKESKEDFWPQILPTISNRFQHTVDNWRCQIFTNPNWASNLGGDFAREQKLSSEHKGKMLHVLLIRAS